MEISRKKKIIRKEAIAKESERSMAIYTEKKKAKETRNEETRLELN
jgi:hypothetical protein